MKKNLFFVAVVAAALAGCSSDESLSNVNDGTITDGELVPVELGLSRGIVDVYQTRGTGTVGDTAKTKNDYQCEDLYVLMTDNTAATWGFTKLGNPGVAQFDGSFKSRAVYDGESTVIDAEGDEVKVWAIEYKAFTGGQVKYYPIDGHKSDFFAFYVDDAALETDADGNPVILPEEDPDADPDPNAANEKYVEFQIDGSQDILAGKAFYPEGVEGGFSAKTARKGIKPRIPMKHMLTRLTFSVQPNAKAMGVKIKSIQVTSQNKGKLFVAYKEEGTRDAETTEDVKGLIKWEEGAVDFSLGYREGNVTNAQDPENPDFVRDDKNPLSFADTENGEYLYEIPAEDPDGDIFEYDEEGNIKPIKVGEAMFVRPNQTEYALKVEFEYPTIVGEDADGNPIAGTMEDSYLDKVIKLPNDAVMEDGSSYNVNIKIYGLEEIELETTLENWKDGGEAIEIDPDAE